MRQLRMSLLGCYLATAFLSVCLMIPLNPLYANAVPEPAINLDPAAPSLPNLGTATDSDKLLFALYSQLWAKTNHPTRDFILDPSGKPIPVEWQLYEVLAVLRTFPDSPGDIAMRKQDEQLGDAAWKTIEKVIVGDFKGALKEVAKSTTMEVVTADGQAHARDALAGWAMNQLLVYESKLNEAPMTITQLGERFAVAPVATIEASKSLSEAAQDNVRMFQDAEVLRQTRLTGAALIRANR